jgi:two-component system, chemotaxis family, CheB/CheR fusion protein
VGIGASAGGLAALEGFFSAMSSHHEPGMAFVIVQHLAPDHKSILTDLIQRCTPLRVTEVENGVTVQPDCIYIIPPNRDMALLHGSLQLLEPTTPRLRRLPIDFFFKSLAQDRRERAIGIVLSGTGSDGTIGVRAIKSEGGMVMVQHPEAAEYDGMPRSAIATGLVDFVLPVAEMPAKLLAYAGHALRKASQPTADEPPAGDVALATIFVLLRAQTGHNFSQYKPSTIYRRIQRRMAMHQIENLEGYVRLLQGMPAEVDVLFRELLIRVTSFFRDAEAFEVLKSELAQRVLPAKRAGQSIRVWVPGCCTGEEAYSLAILLQELVAEVDRDLEVHVFATDIDGTAIEQARSGIYPAGIAAEMSPERLARAFDAEPESGRYRVKKALRDLLIFSEQDVIRDPPFSRLDLISCRNLMIYLGAELQVQLLSVFHYALNSGGLLLLGTSESVGDQRNLFTSLDTKSKLYQRLDDSRGTTRTGIARPYPSLASGAAPLRSFQQRPRGRRLSLRDLAEREMLQQFAAVGVLVNERGDILYLHGRTGSYLEPAPGESSFNVLGMAREGLRPALTTAMHEAVTGKRLVRRPGLRVQTNGSFAEVDLTIRHLVVDRSAVADSSLYLIVLETPRHAEPAGPIPASAAGVTPIVDDPAADADTRIAHLKEELQVQADYLQISRHDLEVSNEELKATNEAFQSLNEELQSTNEEMETSKEELQSVNEELATVNAELQQRVLQLSRSNNDLNNLIAGTGVGTIFVDHELRIQRFTPEATALINLIPGDIGRPLGQIVSNLVGYDRLLPDIQAVLESLTPREVEVHTASTWYLLRMRPYRTLKNVIEGAVITFTDITELKNGQEGLRRLAIVVRDSRDAIVVQDLAGHILAWNPGAQRLYGWTENEALAMNIRELVPAAERDGAAARVQRLAEAKSIQPHRSQRIAKDGRVVEIELTASALANEAGVPYAVSTTEREHHD